MFKMLVVEVVDAIHNSIIYCIFIGVEVILAPTGKNTDEKYSSTGFHLN